MPFLVPIVALVVLNGEAPRSLETLGKFDLRAIPEASGIVKSRRYPDIFWVHNDSGNPAAIFAIRRNGSIVREFRIAAPNIDWEDIAADEEGHLYLGDIGNNGGILAIRMIYQINEPDPERPVKDPLPSKAATFYAPPRTDRFDAEGLFIQGGQAVVVAKRFDGRDADLFAIPFHPAAPLLRPATPKPIGALPRFRQPATGASLTADGRLLAVCSSSVTRVYRRGEIKPWELLAEVRHDPREIEGITWDGQDLLLVSEGGGIDRLREAKWKLSANP
jgi:hypothetical protein